MGLVGVSSGEATCGVALVYHIIFVFVDRRLVERTLVSLFRSVLLHVAGQVTSHLKRGATVGTLVNMTI